MQPSLSVAKIDLSGAGSVLDGPDVYTTSLAGSQDLPDGSAVSYIRVGRGLQPIGLAYYHVSPDAS